MFWRWLKPRPKVEYRDRITIERLDDLEHQVREGIRDGYESASIHHKDALDMIHELRRRLGREAQ